MVDEAGVWASGGWVGWGGGGQYRAVEIQAIEKLLCFFPLYLRIWNNTVMILFSRIELCASKQYYFLTSFLSLFVCSTRIMCTERWGECLLAT